MTKILICDDSLFMREDIKENIGSGYEIIEAGLTVDILRHLKVSNPDIILMDMLMPDGEILGLSLIKKIKKNKPAIQIILVTGIEQSNIIEECQRLGVQVLTVEPFAEKKVVEIVQKHLKQL